MNIITKRESSRHARGKGVLSFPALSQALVTDSRARLESFSLLEQSGKEAEPPSSRCCTGFAAGMDERLFFLFFPCFVLSLLL
jgi:hypothetical protein